MQYAPARNHVLFIAVMFDVWDVARRAVREAEARIVEMQGGGSKGVDLLLFRRKVVSGLIQSMQSQKCRSHLGTQMPRKRGFLHFEKCKREMGLYEFGDRAGWHVGEKVIKDDRNDDSTLAMPEQNYFSDCRVGDASFDIVVGDVDVRSAVVETALDQGFGEVGN